MEYPAACLTVGPETSFLYVTSGSDSLLSSDVEDVYSCTVGCSKGFFLQRDAFSA